MPEPTATFAEAQALQQAGELRRAERAYRRLLRSEPRSARIWFALAQLCEADRRPAEAVACFRQAVELEPANAERHVQFGSVLLGQARYAEAEAAYRRSLQLQPNDVIALVNLGFVLGEQERYDDARACYEQALKLRPDLPEAHHNLANVFREQGQLERSLVSFSEAMRLRPDYAKAYINRGIALVALGRLDEAIRDLEEGVRLQPNLSDAHTSLGAALSVVQRFDEALGHYDRALALNPGHAETAWNQSLVWLLLGDYARGWPAYEWRWRCKRTTPLPAFDKPRWDGGPLDGQTILLYGEQGLGDVMHFVRYAPLIKARGARVVVQCQNALLKLLSRTPGIDQQVGWGAPPPAYDVWLPLMSVPAILGTTVDNIPAAVPYIHPDPELVAHWRRQLSAVRGFRIGIAWQGSPRHAWDRHRSVALDQFEPLARVGGVQLISLQKGPGSEQLAALNGRFPVLSLASLDETAGPFMDTAAVLANLDLVITVDSAIAHLAGAMAVPGWLALSYTPDWRWLLGRDDSVWYPSLKLFRQPTLGDWAGVFAGMAERLKPAVAAHRPSRPLSVEVSAGELIDKITILQIKSDRLTDAGKLANVRTELAALQTAARDELPASTALDDLTAQLKTVNERLWEIEEEIRNCERQQDFGPRFIELARSVYRENDQRSAVKRSINELLGSRLIEEKSYPDYTPSKPHP